MREVAGAIILLAASILVSAGIACDQFAESRADSPYLLLYIFAGFATILGLVLIFKDSQDRR